MPGYWEQRTNLPYYGILRRWLEEFGACESLLDVGCHDTPVATWGAFTSRYTIDPRPRPSLHGVTAILGEWPDAAESIPCPVDVITCLQVLEHLPDPGPFAAALFRHARRAVILSVPYLWRAGACKYHLHDPVDETKLLAWTGRTPTQTVITPAPRRLVAAFIA